MESMVMKRIFIWIKHEENIVVGTFGPNRDSMVRIFVPNKERI